MRGREGGRGGIEKSTKMERNGHEIFYYELPFFIDAILAHSRVMTATHPS